MFNPSSDDPLMYNVYEIKPDILPSINRLLKGEVAFDLLANTYYVECRITSINSTSKVDMALAPEEYSRDQQKKSWLEVLDNVTKYLGGKETSRTATSKEQEEQKKKTN